MIEEKSREVEDSIDVKFYERQDSLVAKTPRRVDSGKSEELLEVGATRELPQRRKLLNLHGDMSSVTCQNTQWNGTAEIFAFLWYVHFISKRTLNS